MGLNDQSHYELLTSLMSDGFYVIQDYRFVFVNPAFEKLLGAQSGELIGQSFDQFIIPPLRDMIVKRYQNRISGLVVPKHYEVTFLGIDRVSKIVVWLEVDTYKEDDHRVSVAGIVRDIGSYKSLKQELADTRVQLQIILENMADTLYQADMEGYITLISSNVLALLGFTQDEVIGSKMAEYYWSPDEREKLVQAIVENNGVVTNVEALLKRKDGSPVWISTNAYVRSNDKGEPVSVEGLARDVTRQKELEQKLERLALTDSLTSLPNRRALMDELHLQFNESREKGSALSLIYFDVNEFKKINDENGHLVGDMLLRHISTTIRCHVVSKKMLGRLSGDEFLFIMPQTGVEKATRMAHKIIDDIKFKPLVMEKNTVSVSISVGISELKKEDKNEYILLDRADKAMYLAKHGEMNLEVM